MNGHPHRALEQREALAKVAQHYVQMLQHLRAVQHLNAVYALGLDLPTERPLIDAINQAANLVNPPRNFPSR